jgi:hypothetical protein
LLAIEYITGVPRELLRPELYRHPLIPRNHPSIRNNAVAAALDGVALIVLGLHHGIPLERFQAELPSDTALGGIVDRVLKAAENIQQLRSAVMIPTPRNLATINRRLDQQRRQAEQATVAMRNGASLHYLGGDRWQLSTGETVSPVVARILTFNRRVIPCGDCLFGSDHPELSQTWRWSD